MSWSLRVLVVTVTLIWGLAPQLACFMPDQALTQHEMDCCEQMAGTCSQTDMSCCRPVVRTDVPGLAARPVRNIGPDVHIAPRPVSIAGTVPANVLAEFPIQNDHAPPPDVGSFSLILRI